MCPDFLQSNLETLSRRNPALANRIRNLPESSSVAVAAADSGDPTAEVILPDGTRKRLHSRRDPRREAAQWAESLEGGGSRTHALFGIGLGYPVEEFLRVRGKDLGALWCFEASPNVFRAMLSWKDWRRLIEDPNVLLFVGCEEQEVRALAAERFQQIIVDGIEIVEYPPAAHLDPEWREARRQNLLDLVRQWTSEMLTVMERGPLFQRNTLANFRALGDSFLFRDVGQVLQGGPAILVSAGPSLNKNADRLQAAKGRIPIVAVDTALRILQRHGITPDLVVSIDPLGLSARHFEGVQGLENIPLAYDLECTPEVAQRHPGPCFLVGNNKPILYGWFEEITGPLERLTKGLTVAQAAFLLLARWGADPIVLVGQDLSFEREGGKTHADGAAFQGRFVPAGGGGGKWEDPLNPKGLEEISVLWVPANDGGKVPTTHTLFAYLKRFEEDIATTGARVINATEGGARIHGAAIRSLEEALDQILPRVEGPFPGFTGARTLQRLGERYPAELERMREEMLSLLAHGREHCRAGYQVSDKLWRDLGWKNLSDREARARFETIFSHYGWIRDTRKVQMLIDRGVMKSLYMLHKGDLPPPEERTPEQHRVVAERYRAFFAEALDAIRSGIEILS